MAGMNPFLLLSKGDKVRIKKDAPVEPIVLKAANCEVWNDDSVEIDLRGQIGEVVDYGPWMNGGVCLMVTIAGCIKVRTYQSADSGSLECVGGAVASGSKGGNNGD